jgi:hypothetical protein
MEENKHKLREIFEYIYRDNRDNKIKILVITSENIRNIDFLRTTFSIYHKNIDKFFCLDFHNIADLYNDKEQIVPKNAFDACILSFVGRKMKDVTRDEVIQRITNNQIKFGFLVFKKLKMINKETHFIGTKRTPIEILILFNSIKKIYFIDDHQINIDTVDSLGDPIVESHKYVGDKKGLMKLIALLENK